MASSRWNECYFINTQPIPSFIVSSPWGGQAAAPQKAAMTILRGAGAMGEMGGFMVTQTEAALNTCSSSPPLHKHSLSPLDLQRQREWVGFRAWVPTEKRITFSFQRLRVWLKVFRICVNVDDYDEQNGQELKRAFFRWCFKSKLSLGFSNSSFFFLNTC